MLSEESINSIKIYGLSSPEATIEYKGAVHLNNQRTLQYPNIQFLSTSGERGAIQKQYHLL